MQNKLTRGTMKYVHGINDHLSNSKKLNKFALAFFNRIIISKYLRSIHIPRYNFKTSRLRDWMQNIK